MLKTNPKVFKAYDIRGIYNVDFDDHFAYQLGLAYVKLRKSDSDHINKPLQIAVACDMRISSPALKKSLIEGLVNAGVKVIDLGEISTPSFYFAVGKYNYSGGIMISASHNPKEWNGFKLVRAKGIAISGDSGIEILKELILNNQLEPSENKGRVIKKEGIIDEEVKYSLDWIKKNNIKPLKIIVDTANGMGSTYIKKLFAKLPVQLIPLNFSLDGTFPVHEADPIKPENMKELQEEVIKNKADLGLSTDGDGDRIFFVDNEGKTINQAIIRGLLSQLFLEEKPGAKIGYDVRPGKITVDLIKESGGQAIMTRVGHSLIKEQMLKEGIYFAGESSGHFFLHTDVGCFEYPMIMILKLLNKFSQLNTSIADFIKPFNKYISSGEINREVEDKEEVINKIAEHYRDGKINRLDGVSVTYDDFWFNVRASNTENVVRLNLEAIDQKTMEEKRDEVLKLMK